MYKYVTQIKNWFLRDPLVDYLIMYGDKTKKSPASYYDFSQYIMGLGNKYEDYIVAQLKDRCNSLRLKYTTVERKNGYHETKQAYRCLSDVIFQPQVKDWDLNITGYPDILVRVGAWNTLFPEHKLEIDTKLGNEYIVIDVKYSSLDNQNDYLHDIDEYTHYVCGQVAIYTQILNKNRKIKIDKAFVISNNPETLQKPLAVNVLDIGLNKDIQDAWDWLHQLHYFGKGWTLSPPTNKYLLPNMNNIRDGEWREYKQLIATELKEISLIHGISNAKREQLHSLGVYSYDKINEALVGIESFGYIKSMMNSDKNINKVNIKSDSGIIVINCIWGRQAVNFHTNDNAVCILHILIRYNNEYHTFVNTTRNKEGELLISEDVERFVRVIQEGTPHILQRIIYYSSQKNTFANDIYENDGVIAINLYTLINRGIMFLSGMSNPKLSTIVTHLENKGVLPCQRYNTLLIKNSLEATVCLQSEHITQRDYELVYEYQRVECDTVFYLYNYLNEQKLVDVKN